uniref:Si:ch73-71c20.5 n=1 Tax=Takifugu rubripes TaxID=31033 RepID=A0A3B5KBF2_TAKRU
CFSCCWTLIRTFLIPRWGLLTRRRRSLAACQRLRLHVSPAASCSSSRTEPQKSGEASSTSRLGEDLEGPEYIPKRKAKNPMMKIGYAWMIGLPTGIIGFLLAKRQVDKNRLKQLKIRQRMKKSNEGEYVTNDQGFAPGLEVKSSVWTV